MSRERTALLLAVLMLFPLFATCVEHGLPSFTPQEKLCWLPSVPVRRLTIVGFDDQGFDDDFAFMAAVPSAVFAHDNTLYVSPVLYYSDYKGSGENKSWASNDAYDYFIEDWLNLTGKISSLDLLCMGDRSVKIQSEKTWRCDLKPPELSSALALRCWKNSEYAVIAPYRSIEEKILEYEGCTNGTLENARVLHYHFSGKKNVSPIPPKFHNFTVANGMKYLIANMEWHGYFKVLDPITQRGKDPDMQIYDWDVGEVAASQNWNVISGPYERAETYVYSPGAWGIGVTYMPTESIGGEQPLGGEADYDIYVETYPGVEVDIGEMPFFCRNFKAELDWDGNANLGLLLLGPNGEVVAKSLGDDKPKNLTAKELGMAEYRFCVLALDNITGSVHFTISYSYQSRMNYDYALILSSAANGAVLASILNAPLLYADGGDVSAIKDALKSLGVERAFIVDLTGKYCDEIARGVKKAKGFFSKIGVDVLRSDYDIYHLILDLTKQEDVLFTTVNPWSYWIIGQGCAGEKPGALYIGPASYLAAVHGIPVVVTDIYSGLSSAQAWHNDFWIDAYARRKTADIGAMVMTAREIFSELERLGMCWENMDIITVAGQFDIGTAWDRALVGKARAGRIVGTPIDTAAWCSRAALYEHIIFTNPGVEGNVEMITGSKSRIAGGILQIMDRGGKVRVKYPVVQTWVSYCHRFNERASKYWGCDYVCTNGVVPFRTKSNDPIDDGVNGDHGGAGCWPDLNPSEVVPFYAKKCGYSSVFSTNFSATMYNINAGAIMWLEIMHGGSRGAGVVGFWSDKNHPQEPNPWRAYEQSGCTREPDTMTMSKTTGLDVRWDMAGYQHDGVVITILSQATQTDGYDGYDLDNAMGNLHSMGFFGGSCLIANTYLHMSLIRHGSVFQVIDPWTTSWYCSFAIEVFMREIAKGATVGEAYTDAISMVGIGYSTSTWWWDVAENVVYYGDPELVVYSPAHGWEKKEPISGEIGGHVC